MDKTMIKKRIDELRKEYDAGQKELKVLDKQTKELQSTLSRIAAAIKVLEDQLAA